MTHARTTYDPADRSAAVAETRRRFGGLDVPAGLAGMLVALGTMALLGGILAAAIGAFGYRVEVDTVREVTIAGAIAGGVALLVSFLLGGWAAGRIARYSGALNGLMTAVWFLILGAILALLGVWIGERYNLFVAVADAEVRSWFPEWFAGRDLTAEAAISMLVGFVLIAIAGMLGGLWGQHYHRRADDVLIGLPASEVVNDGEHAHRADDDDRVEVHRHADGDLHTHEVPRRG